MNPFWDNFFRSDRREKILDSALRANPLFQDLGPREIKLVQRMVNIRTYAPGERIFQQGEIGVGMYILLSGSIDISTEEHGQADEPPRSQFVTRLKEGDFFGEIALTEETGRRTATATAREESLLVGFFKPDLLEIARRNPSAGVKILWGLSRVLGHRLHETTSLVRSLKRNAGTAP